MSPDPVHRVVLYCTNFTRAAHERGARRRTRNARHRFALTTGRLRDPWHGCSRAGSVPKLFAHAPAPSVDLNPGDCARLGIGAGVKTVTSPALDPHSRQPALKHAAIKLLKADLPWRWPIGL